MISPLRKCNDVEFDARVEENYDWQTVDNETAFVFSSYYVEKTKTIIIIGARSQHHMGYFCLFWHDNKGKHTAEQVDASVKQLPEGHDLWYVKHSIKLTCLYMILKEPICYRYPVLGSLVQFRL
jgi:hypothetical protein